MLRRFVLLNQRLSRRVSHALPHAMDLHKCWEERVTQHMNTRRQLLVLDAGGGRACRFAHNRRRELDTTIVALDVSEEELRLNEDVDETRVADLEKGFPFPAGTVDLLVSKSTIEHLSSVDAFVRDSRRVMRDGGRVIHVLPCRFAPFAILNRLLPRAVTSRLLRYLLPWSEGVLGFPAHYEQCYPSAMQRLLEANGFEVEELIVSYRQPDYFDFFFPLFLLSVGYEMLARLLRARDLCAAFLIVARAVPRVPGSSRHERR